MELYYCPDLESEALALSPEESRHCIKVMHHSVGDSLFLTDGKGIIAEAIIMGYDKNNCFVHIVKKTWDKGKRLFTFHLAIAPTKNHDRMEWLTEKAIEIGVEKISFIICEHSERQKMDFPRIERIAVAAMKQSLTPCLPFMEIISFDNFLQQYGKQEGNKYIAWCLARGAAEELAKADLSSGNIILMIGPEGDFSPKEIEESGKYDFQEIKLGPKRLRTETAALYGCCIIAGRKL
jgi:16S rRNA (uracil1498-N3)-methyltransferase